MHRWILVPSFVPLGLLPFSRPWLFKAAPPLRNPKWLDVRDRSQVEQKLDDKLGSVSNTLKTELSVTEDEMQRIIAMSETLQARLSEDRDELKKYL